MIIQFVLSLGLAGCLFYVLSLGRAYRFMRVILFAIVLIGLLFVWIPDTTNVIAKSVGVGRGADLMIYLWIVINLMLVLRLHIKLREQSEQITLLVRQMALRDASVDDTSI